MNSNQASHISTYVNIMKNFDFMSNYTDDVPEIFQPTSQKCQDFLVQSFTHLEPSFHYLSFLNSDDLDKKLIHAAKILQIYPSCQAGNCSLMFENFSECDINGFWMKFFSLFILKNQELKNRTKKKINNFSDMKVAEDYLNYKFALVKPQNSKGIDVENEVKSWTDLEVQSQNSNSPNVENEMKNWTDSEVDGAKEAFSIKHHTINFLKDETLKIKLEKLASYVQFIQTRYSDRKSVTYEGDTSYELFFKDFNEIVKDIVIYHKYMNLIDTPLLKEKNYLAKIENEELWCHHISQIKRCNYLISRIKNCKKVLHGNKDVKL